jgi:hypothetical protein
MRGGLRLFSEQHAAQDGAPWLVNAMWIKLRQAAVLKHKYLFSF